ncbi:unnamed protein product [Cylicostephanus goldi]|uniref:Uncharacterized protein n=1 Tax=Cylicostephanus goldi TaxID=71465 RepID=A0A3P6QI83_CYLGO|nr:unnamed protein product [Cylicostephanus goldi]
MDFQDDADILSRLGILESKEESPRKHFYSPKKADVSSERDRFVEVNIDGSVEARSDSDEEPVFDRNSLLSPNKGVKVYRRRNESYTCVYLVLLLTYAAVGASYPLAWAGFQFDKKIPFSFLLENNVGLLIGCLTEVIC